MSERGIGRRVIELPAMALAGIIRLYQVVISPLTGPSCKYYPSCSSYGLTAVRRHGAVRGGTLAVWRVLRCNPWSNGGVDDVPAVGDPLFRRTTSTSAGTHASAHAH